MKKHFEQFAIAALLSVVAIGSLSGRSIGAEDPQVALGKKVFERATCEGCHSNGTNSLNPNKPIKGAKFHARYKDDAILEQVIRHGFPRSGMPSFPKSTISDKDMKALVSYIRSLTPKDAK